MEAQSALAELAARDHFGFQPVREPHPLAHAHLLAGMHQRLPFLIAAAHRPQQQHLHFAGEIFVPCRILLAHG